MSRRSGAFEQAVIPGLVDHREVRWDRVVQTTYLVHQTFRYEYPGPIEELRHRLVIVPPQEHGDQRRVVHHLRVSGDTASRLRPDAFGNVLLEVHAPRVDRAIEFEAWIEVDRRAATGPPLLPGTWLTDRRLLQPTPLTAPDAAIRLAAAEIGAGRERNLELVEDIARWVHSALRYERGITNVGTTAAQALALGAGVCQDYSHLMLAVCRLLGLPSRYVSGHLLGEGATHAWVEVLTPDPAGSALAAVWAHDPTNGRRSGLDYVTVAVGRDYRDVAPTAGTYRAPSAGRLATSKRVDITRVEY